MVATEAENTEENPPKAPIRRAWKVWLKWLSVVLPIALSVVALILSSISNRTANEALEFTKEESARHRQYRLIIGAEWARNDIEINEIGKSSQYPPVGADSLYEGLGGFVLLKITNTGDLTISIDRVRVFYSIPSGSLTTPWTDRLLDRDMKRPATFPVNLGSGESLWLGTNVPIPISSRLARMMTKLPAHFIYSGSEILAALRRDPTLDSLSKAMIAWLQEKLNEEGSWPQTRSAKVPAFLIEMSDPGHGVGRGGRALKVHVDLGSGASVDTTIDYLNVLGSVMQF